MKHAGRETKFGAWDIIRRKMFRVIGITYSGNGEYWAISEVECLNNNGVSSIIIPRDQIILIEYTGLKDKNGKEIYEGDRVRYIHKDLSHPVDFTVVFFEGAFVQDKPEDKRYKPDLWYDWDTLEVIGNIYENPDLL